MEMQRPANLAATRAQHAASEAPSIAARAAPITAQLIASLNASISNAPFAAGWEEHVSTGQNRDDPI